MCRRNRLDLSNSLYGYIHYYHCWGELHLRLSLSSGRHLLGTNSGSTMLAGLPRPAHDLESHPGIYRIHQRLALHAAPRVSRPRDVSAIHPGESRALLGRNDARVARRVVRALPPGARRQPRTGMDAVVHRRTPEHRPQLPGPLGGGRSRGLPLGSRERRHRRGHVPRGPRPGQPGGQRTARARPRGRRPRGALLAHGAGDPRHPLRLFQGGAHGGADLRHAPGGCGRARFVHRGFPGAARQARSVGRQNAAFQRSYHRAAHAFLGRLPLCSAARIANPVVRFRSARLPALHLRHHGQTKGHGAHPRWMPGANGQGDLAGLRPPRRRPLLLAQRHRLDDGSVDHPRESPVRRHHLPL